MILASLLAPACQQVHLDSMPSRVTPVEESLGLTPTTRPSSGTLEAQNELVILETRHSGGIWKPTVGAAWQWQLDGPLLELDMPVEIYDLDAFETEVGTIEQLHALGRKVICYISAGSWEEWRPDAGEFDPEIIGEEYQGWPGERWLDIRQRAKLEPIMQKRLELCWEKGFDAVEPDNIDGYTNRTGFQLTYQGQLEYNRWLADAAHALGLAIGLKNDPEQVVDLLPYFDFAISEDCFADGWCQQLLPFIQAGKAVLAAEYSDTDVDMDEACALAKRWSFSLILKNRNLNAFREDCQR